MNADVVPQLSTIPTPPNTSTVDLTTEVIVPSEVQLVSRDDTPREGQTSWIFNHPEMLALNPSRKWSPKTKLFVSVAINLSHDYNRATERRNQAERVSTFAWLARMFGHNEDTPQAIVAPPPAVTQKTLWEKINPSISMPILVVILAAVAAWNTAELASWKSTAEAKKEQADTYQQNWKDEKAANKDLTQKNDDLQEQIRDYLATVARDNKTDTQTVIAKLNSLLAQGKTSAKKNTAAGEGTAQAPSTTAK